MFPWNTDSMEFIWNTDFYGFHGFFSPTRKKCPTSALAKKNDMNFGVRITEYGLGTRISQRIQERPYEAN
jgi:hypothetical protein